MSKIIVTHAGLFPRSDQAILEAMGKSGLEQINIDETPTSSIVWFIYLS